MIVSLVEDKHLVLAKKIVQRVIGSSVEAEYVIVSGCAKGVSIHMHIK